MSEDKRISALIRSRGTLKAKLTGFKKFINDENKVTDIIQLKMRNAAIIEDFKLFEKVQDEIELLHENYEEQLLERENFTDNYYECVSKAANNLTEAEKTKSFSSDILPVTEVNNINGSNQSSSSEPLRPVHDTLADQQVQALNLTRTHVRMPAIQLPTFNNTCESWPSFADAFRAAVHENPNLRESEKLIYLKSCLTGKALGKIESLETIDRHYSIAWSILEKSFNDPVTAANRRIKAFLDLPQCKKATEKAISEILDTATKHYRALEALNKPFLEAFPVYAITSKLDEQTRRKWKESTNGTEFPSMRELLEFLHERQRVLEEDSERPITLNDNNRQFRSGHRHSNKNHSLTAVTENARVPLCNLCKEEHFTNRCEKILNGSPNERYELIKNAKLCINCFRSNHSVSTCKSPNTCRKCKRKHHTLLHREDDNSLQSNVVNLYANLPSQVLLSTAIIDIMDNHGNPHACRALLDSGSQTNFMTERMASLLNLPLNEINIPVIGIHQIRTNIKTSIFARISSRINKYTADLTFLTIPKIAGQLPSMPVAKRQLNIPRSVQLADPEFEKPNEIDALLGAEIFMSLMCVGQIHIAKPSVLLTKTQFGWIVSGKIAHEAAQAALACNIALETLDVDLTRFWEIEDGPHTNTLSVEERECREHFKRNTRRDPKSGRYIVRLPFKENKFDLGESYSLALRRFLSLERSFKRKPERWQQYVAFMKEYEELGHMSIYNGKQSEGYYMPHHAVFKDASLTTKIRVVFDASAKTTTGLSLNDILLVGPTIQDDLISITLRFRIHIYVLTADAEKMYRQILVDREDQVYQKILMRFSDKDPIRTFILKTVTYGIAPSSYLTAECLHQLAEDEQHNYPIAAQVLKDDFYVDDLLTGADSFEKAATMRDEIIVAAKSAGINMRKWASNEPKLIQTLTQRADKDHVKLNLGDAIKTLGINWNTRADSIFYSVKLDETKIITKRSILSQIAHLFDPLGLLGPVIVKAKILMQTLWQLKLEWDESVPIEVYTLWRTYKSELPLVEQIQIPRRAIIGVGSRLQLHGFCDASERAYGACLYIRSTTCDNETKTILLCSKSRVAPLKSKSIPRLELCAAHLLSRLLTSSLGALDRSSFENIFLWSDSTIVLHWLKTPCHMLKTFVRNRVADIQELKHPVKWYHIRSIDNPADILSRGIMPSELHENPLWLNGPAWLNHDEEAWPVLKLVPMEIPERREVVTLLCFKGSSNAIDFNRFSSFKRLKRTVAYILRFIQNICKGVKTRRALSVEELHDAFIRIVKIIQGEVFASEIHLLSSSNTANSKLSPLSPFVDSNGILRVGGRLRLSELPFDQKHPILLPAKQHVTKLIIREKHIESRHGGVQATLSTIRTKFWIINGRNVIKAVIHKCVPCFRAKPAVPRYIMGDLPKERVEIVRPFLHAGVDFCGPFFIKEKRHRNRNKEKVYVAIFVCFSTKAVHIELVQDLTSEACLAAIRRFFSRRGRCSDIYSDNGTNFTGAKREIDEIHQFLKSNDLLAISDALANENIKWHFIPSRSPHFGGLWEAAVKSFKRHAMHVIGHTLLTFETLLTYITEIEAILNSRPLLPLSSDPNDLSVLTPGHFLIGDQITNIPDFDYRQIPTGRLSSWQHVQQLKQHFWNRWSKEYLHEQTVRKKWHKDITARDIAINMIVLMKDDNLPPMRWKLARVVAVHPGQDNVVRVATVKTATGEFKRAVKKLAPLPIENETEQDKV